MKIYLVTENEDTEKELHSQQDREEFAELLQANVSEHDFVSASMNDEDGEARFTTLTGLIRALQRYED